MRHLRHQAGAVLQVLPESLDPDSVLEGAWAETRECGEWGEPQGLEAPLAAFRHWLRHLLWELTLLLAQVEPSPLHPLSHCHTCSVPSQSTLLRPGWPTGPAVLGTLSNLP